MSQKFWWKYDKELPKELDINLQNLMKTTMEECRERDWQSLISSSVRLFLCLALEKTYKTKF
jgi:hypothetical protein